MGPPPPGMSVGRSKAWQMAEATEAGVERPGSPTANIFSIVPRVGTNEQIPRAISATSSARRSTSSGDVVQLARTAPPRKIASKRGERASNEILDANILGVPLTWAEPLTLSAPKAILHTTVWMGQAGSSSWLGVGRCNLHSWWPRLSGLWRVLHRQPLLMIFSPRCRTRLTSTPLFCQKKLRPSKTCYGYGISRDQAS